MPDAPPPADLPARPRRRLPLLLALLAALAAGVLLWVDAAPPTSRDDYLDVPPGASASRVAQTLREAGHIRSRRWFLFLVRRARVESRLRAGVYQVRRGQRASSLLRDLVNGRTRRARVTVPEGFASWQIAERLEAQGVCPAADFRAAVATGAAEGYLFPETYYFEEKTPPRRVVDAMRARFETVWADVLAEAERAGAVRDVVRATATTTDDRFLLADGRPSGQSPLGRRPFTRTQAVVLASLVEREARKPEERGLIAAVYHNRLKKGMPLEADPTVQFALGEWKERLLYRDLEVDSPYNTYRRRGLPPGPICNPGRATLSAALDPAGVDHLYFVADEAGGHRFSSTYGAHLRHVGDRNRLRRERRRAGK